MIVPSNAPRELVDFSREEVNEKCPVCWETTEEDDGKLWCAHEHANADLTDRTRIIVLVHPLHKDCAKITYLFQKDYTFLKDCIHGADVKIMSVMPIPRSIRESLGYALIRNAQTIALMVKNGILISTPLVMLACVQIQTSDLNKIHQFALEKIGIVMQPTKPTNLDLPSVALCFLGGLAIIALDRINPDFFEHLNSFMLDTINDLGMQLIGEEGHDEDFRELRALFAAARVEIIRVNEEDI